MTHGSAPDTLPPPPPPSMSQRLAYWRYLMLWESAARLPEGAARRLARHTGSAWHRMASERQRTQVRANLGRVTRDASPSDLDALVVEAYRSYARYWLDSFRLHVMDRSAVVAATTGEGVEHGDAVRDAGRGGIFATAHLGSWDVGALFASQRGWGMVAVAEVVQPRALFDRFVRLRRRAGIDVVPLTRGGDALARLQERIESDGALATLLADRDLTRRGPIVELFGEPCRLPAGVALLARRTARPVVVGALLTEGAGYRAVVLPPLDISGLAIPDGMQAVAHGLERLIGRFPEQWHVFVPNWLADREPSHPVVAAWRNGEDWRPIARAERRAFEHRRA
jgi:phosphatidylinositol dimannoside acyltransferase